MCCLFPVSSYSLVVLKNFLKYEIRVNGGLSLKLSYIFEPKKTLRVYITVDLFCEKLLYFSTYTISACFLPSITRLAMGQLLTISSSLERVAWYFSRVYFENRSLRILSFNFSWVITKKCETQPDNALIKENVFDVVWHSRT